MTWNWIEKPLRNICRLEYMPLFNNDIENMLVSNSEFPINLTLRNEQ